MNQDHSSLEYPYYTPKNPDLNNTSALEGEFIPKEDRRIVLLQERGHAVRYFLYGLSDTPQELSEREYYSLRRQGISLLTALLFEEEKQNMFSHLESIMAQESSLDRMLRTGVFEIRYREIDQLHYEIDDFVTSAHKSSRNYEALRYKKGRQRKKQTSFSEHNGSTYSNSAQYQRMKSKSRR